MKSIRHFRVGLMALLVLAGSSACMPTELRRAVPQLSESKATYAGRWRHWLPRWYTVYTVIPGSQPLICGRPNRWMAVADDRMIAITDCLPSAPSVRLPEVGSAIQAAIRQVEQAFDDRIRISDVRIMLVPPGMSYTGKDSQFLTPKSLRFQIAAVYDQSRHEDSQRRIARDAAHELFHMAWRSLDPRHQTSDAAWSEEASASAFESCIEQAAFGSVSPSALKLADQSDPGAFAAGSGPYRSAAGNLQAAVVLREILGSDSKLSTASERAAFDRLCKSVVLDASGDQG